MEQNLKPILDLLMRPAVEYNAPQKNYWGVVIDEHCIRAISAFFSVKIEGIKERQEPGFFSYLQSKFLKGEYCYPLSLAQIDDRVGSQSSFVGKMVVPVPNLLNRLNDLDEHSQLKKCRIIISPGYLESGDLTLRFDETDGEWVFSHPNIPIVIKRSKDSLVPRELMNKDTLYRCSIVSESDTQAVVNVIEPYGKMRLGILLSPKGFVPTNIEDVNKMTGIIPADMIMCTNTIAPEVIPAPPMHLDASMMLDLMKIFLLANTPNVEIHLPDDPNKPVLITSMPANEEDLRISVTVATLNPFYGAQRR